VALARSRADKVILDCPPVLPVTESAVLSASVDGTLLVATAGLTSTKEVHGRRSSCGRWTPRWWARSSTGSAPTAPTGYAYQYRQYAERNGAKPHAPESESVTPRV
jgi:hypothetical protein